jgi:hypothetical protein
MKTIITALILAALTVSCSGRRSEPKETTDQSTDVIAEGAVIVAHDIVTEVIIKPDPEGDPWEMEKVSGYNGAIMINTLFDRIYDGSLTVYDLHSGEALSAGDVKQVEKEFNNDRSMIGKLSFTEDWLYYPATNRLEKRTKSVVIGYELYNNQGRVYAYRAAFQARLDEQPLP